MIANFVSELGPWSWFVLAMILLAAEVFLPGVYLLWIGVAAALVGAASLQLWSMGFWTWHVQGIVFFVLALACAFVGSKIVRTHDTASDEPLLNQRVQQLIGRTATLSEPISNGRGRIRLGDTLWMVQGPDMPTGAQVRVSGVDGSELVVVPL